eukprot:6200353-Pleurochrysis_carterae.AAC.1
MAVRSSRHASRLPVQPAVCGVKGVRRPRWTSWACTRAKSSRKEQAIGTKPTAQGAEGAWAPSLVTGGRKTGPSAGSDVRATETAMPTVGEQRRGIRRTGGGRRGGTSMRDGKAERAKGCDVGSRPTTNTMMPPRACAGVRTLAAGTRAASCRCESGRRHRGRAPP